MSKITLNQTAGNDNAVIWIVKITIDASTVFYFSDTEDKITLSGTDFDGKVILKDSLQYLDQNINIAYGGTLCSPGNTAVAIARYNAYTGTSDFFDDFYPATSQNYITGRQVQIGVCWTGATTTGEISWLYDFYVDSYSYDWNQISLNLYERAILEGVECPYFEVQDQYDNGISYFPTASTKDMDGAVLPLLYGDMRASLIGSLFQRGDTTAPTILIDESKVKMIVAYHECYSVSNGASGQYECYKYLDGVDEHLRIRRSANTTLSNDKKGCAVTMLDGGSAALVGNLILRLVLLSRDNDISDVSNVVNDDYTDYTVLPASSDVDELALRLVGEASTSEVGYLSATAGDCDVNFVITSDDANDRVWRVGIRNNVTAATDTGTAGTHSAGTGFSTATHPFGATTTTQTNEVNDIWTIEDVLNNDYFIRNRETSEGEDIRVYYGYIELDNIDVYNPYKKGRITRISFGTPWM